MKILLVNSSPRKGGNTSRALAEVEAELCALGAQTTIISLETKNVRTCTECNACMKNKSGRCSFDDDMVNVVSAAAEDSDGLIFASPVYFGLPDGRLMSLVQRMLYSNRPGLAFKVVGNIAVCRRGGATSAIQAMNMPWLMVNTPIASSQYWPIVYGTHPGEAAADAEGMQTMRQLAHNMVWMINGLQRVPQPKQEPRQETHFIREDLLNG